MFNHGTNYSEEMTRMVKGLPQYLLELRRPAIACEAIEQRH